MLIHIIKHLYFSILKKIRSAEKREKFSIAKFAVKYDLGNPVAGNFYQAQYDDYVPLLYKQLGA